MAELDLDSQVRLHAFQFLERQTQVHGEVLPKAILDSGFEFHGQRVPLMGPQGIFKPAVLRVVPLTITTVPIVEGKERPYDDEVSFHGLIHYRYRGTNPEHRDNVGLRFAMTRKVPLIYLFGIVPGHYMPVWPVYIVADDPQSLTFTVSVDNRHVLLMQDAESPDTDQDLRRRYVTINTQMRLHQQSFRLRVLRAYRECCAVCRLRHQELLEAAHILPDSHPRGNPVLPNGISLCRLHHGAFDRNLLGIRPDLVIEIRKDILDEEDGPMLEHGLQGFQGKRIIVPTRASNRPDPNRLEERYEMFKTAI